MLLLGFTGIEISTYVYKQQKKKTTINTASIYFPKIQTAK